MTIKKLYIINVMGVVYKIIIHTKGENLRWRRRSLLLSGRLKKRSESIKPLRIIRRNFEISKLKEKSNDESVKFVVRTNFLEGRNSSLPISFLIRIFGFSLYRYSVTLLISISNRSTRFKIIPSHRRFLIMEFIVISALNEIRMYHQCKFCIDCKR